jgi:peptide/nickel transport system substrate-binding protein
VYLNHRLWCLTRSVFAVVLVAALVSACGSSGNSNSGVSASTTGASGVSIKQTGPGLTEPTAGNGAKVKGGAVTLAEAPDAPPNYIFPMYAAQYCGTNNVQELNTMLYRPLYWYGNNYSPTVDYNDSIGTKPVFTQGDRTVTIHLNHYTWSDGEQVTSRDLVLWMNILKADPAHEWCLYAPGLFPDNVVGYSAPNPTTFVMHLNRAYNPTWFLYNELSQIYPLPMAWDRTSLSQKAPSPNAKHLPDTTKAGAAAVYNFLNTQSLKISDWASSPLWSVVDGPWKVASTTSNGGVTFVPNKDYSGPTKASVSKFSEVPFTSESALVDQVKAGGPSGLNVAYIPAQDQPLTSSFQAQGYDVNKASVYSFNYIPLNYNNPRVGPIFRQLYFRQTLQHLVDQKGWIKSFLHGAAVPTYGPVPLAPSTKLLTGVASTTSPYAFSVTDASKLLKANGWKVVPGGASYCEKPGTAAGDCGKGITKGEQISFNIDYESGVTVVQEEMEDLQSQASKVGIKINVTTHPADDVFAAAAHCSANQAKCKWTSEYWGSGWVYFPDYYPTGEYMFSSGSIDNYSSYVSPEMNRLVHNTVVSSASEERQNMKKFVQYAEKQLPVLFAPTSIGTFGASAGTLIDNKLGGYAANAFGFLTPEDWYLVK